LINAPFSNWWCCLNPRESNTIVLTLALFVTNPLYIERAAFDLMVAATGEASSIKMLESFMTVYSLEYGTVPDGEGGEKEVVLPTDGFWVAMLAFSFTPEYVCAGKCKLLTFPL